MDNNGYIILESWSFTGSSLPERVDRICMDRKGNIVYCIDDNMRIFTLNDVYQLYNIEYYRNVYDKMLLHERNQKLESILES